MSYFWAKRFSVPYSFTSVAVDSQTSDPGTIPPPVGLETGIRIFEDGKLG